MFVVHLCWPACYFLYHIFVQIWCPHTVHAIITQLLFIDQFNSLSPSCQHYFRLWFFVCSAKSHGLNQCWLIHNYTLKNNFGETWIKIPNFSFNKMHFKMLAKWQPFCSGLNVSKLNVPYTCTSPLSWAGVMYRHYENCSYLLHYVEWHQVSIEIHFQLRERSQNVSVHSKIKHSTSSDWNKYNYK